MHEDKQDHGKIHNAHGQYRPIYNYKGTEVAMDKSSRMQMVKIRHNKTLPNNT